MGPKLTVEEYLIRERAAEFRHELRDGQMLDIHGGTLDHSSISLNLVCVIHNAPRVTRFQPFGCDLRLGVPSIEFFTYADAGVYCDDPEVYDEHDDVLLNPIVLAEVLSPSSEAYDRGEKFRRYRVIPTLRQYLLAAQDEPRLELYTRQPDDRWTLKIADKMDQSIELSCIGVTLPLIDVYRNVDFRRATPRNADLPTIVKPRPT